MARYKTHIYQVTKEEAQLIYNRAKTSTINNYQIFVKSAMFGNNFAMARQPVHWNDDDTFLTTGQSINNIPKA